MSDSSSASLDLGLGLGSSGSESEPVEPTSRFLDDEAEECEESEDAAASRLSDSENEPLQSDEEGSEEAGAKRKAAGGKKGAKRRRIIADDDDDEGVVGKSFMSETGDEGFAALGAEFDAATFLNSPAKKSAKAKPAVDPRKLPSDPATLEAERLALEGPGAGQLRLEMRSLEVTGMKLLKTSKEAHEFLIFLRKLLAKHHAAHVQISLKAEVNGKARAEYLFDRLRRRYWARRRGVAEAATNTPLALYHGTATVAVPMEPSDVGLVGMDLPPSKAEVIGRRAAGTVVQAHQVKSDKPLPDAKEYVVVWATADHIRDIDVAAGGYGSCTATVNATAVFVPLQEGGTLAGVVTEVQKPHYELNRCISLPTKPGYAKVRLVPGVTVCTTFGPEVPVRSLAVGRVWILRLAKTKNAGWKLQFSVDPFLSGEAGDAADVEEISPQRVGAMNDNRRVCHVQASRNWAACDDARHGWRIVKALPDRGYWNPTSLREVYGRQWVRDTEVEIGTKAFLEAGKVPKATLTVNEHMIDGKTSQEANLEVWLPGRAQPSVVRLHTPYSKDVAAASRELCLKLARTIEVLVILAADDVEPREGTLVFSEGSTKHDDKAPMPKRHGKAGAVRKHD